MNDYQVMLVEVMARGIGDVRAIARFFPQDRIDWQPQAGLWSARRHLHHLRDVEARYLDRLEGVLREGQYAPPVQHTDPDEAVAAIVDGFATARERELAIFRGLRPDDWRRTFVHPTPWGEVTTEWWAERMIEHTTDHLHNLWMLKQFAGMTPASLERLVSAMRSS